MDKTALRRFVERAWNDSITPALVEYIKIPNQSPGFDPQWREHGHMDAAVNLIRAWIDAQGVRGLQLDVVRDGARSPLLFIEVAGDARQTVLMYGHLDKQPPMEGWNAGLGPWTPVLRDGRLYGRGGADDGYSAFAAVTAIRALQEQGLPHARCVILIEACEESGSGDLPHYVDRLQARIGNPNFVVCLDSGCGNYEQLWLTASLRGMVNGTLTVRVLDEGVHSGGASGIVPSTFRIARQLLSRIEDESSGEVLLPDLWVDIPRERRQQITTTAAVLGDTIGKSFPYHAAAQAIGDDPRELLLNRTWRPQLEVTGASGLPALENAGNVLRPATTLKLSMRLPPTAKPKLAAAALKRVLEHDPPYAASVRFDCHEGAGGWNAPALAPWLAQAVDQASQDVFGKPPCFMGEGGTIPFMAMLGEKFPEAQFMITGVLGPHSNAHGPNEFLELSMAKGLTACVASVLFEHARAGSGLSKG
ncbi:MAG: M20 family metallopeptidase [Deltaproteobacteria bacterium]|nr:M20 family metallopeptidase [Deltaproteobacteria bacterium]